MESKDIQMVDETVEPVEIECKYFDLGDGYVCAQLSTQMSAEEYKKLLSNEVIDEAAMKAQKRVGRAMILCLDKSGSMSGTPYNALKEGAKLVGKSLFENQEFEHFATVFYDTQANGV